jgi:hypothetical protein
MIILHANDCSIEIDPSIKIWCKCWFTLGADRTYLGAQHIDYLKEHLLIGLDDAPKKVDGHLRGYNFSRVLSLSEVHAVLYVAQDGQDKLFLWQDANARDIGTIRLSPEQILAWRKQLTEI